MPEPREYLPLSPLNFYILACLVYGPKHGYSILKAVESLSDGEIRPAVGNLYVGLRRISEQGLIEPVIQAEQDSHDRRKVYRLTELGTAVLFAEAERMFKMSQKVPTHRVAVSGA